MGISGRALALLLPGLLGSCGFLAVPAQNQPAPAAPPPVAAALPPPAAQPGAPETIIVGPGDSVYSVARRTNAPIRAIIEANHLEPPFVLRAHQALIIPHPQTYVVRPGETLLGVARQNSVEVSELVRANDLKPPYRLIPGQLLLMPERVAAAPVQAPAVPEAEVKRVELLPPQAAPPAASPPSAQPPPPPPPPVAASTTLGGGAIAITPLAPPPQATPEATADAPIVVVPTPAPPPVPDYAAPAKEAAPAAPPASAPPAPPKLAAASPEPDDQAGPGGASGGHFLWPVKGKLLSGYGQKEGGLVNDGINIAVKPGTPVMAADAGVVVYAGNEIRGFGNLVLIKHANGWMTAYAHNETLLVKRGEEVRRGQAIARAGASGTVASPQLHFEIRRGSRAVDPTKYMDALSS